MNAREAILGRLRAAPLSAPPVTPDVTAWYAGYRRPIPPVQRAAALRRALEAVKTEVYDVTHADWVDVLLGLLTTKGVRQMLIGAGTAHGEALARQAPPALQIVRYEEPIESWRDRLFDGIDAALTLARAAVADTGSLILWPTPAEPRLMSLVPPLNVVLLDANTLHSNLHEAMMAEGWAQGMPTNALLISGPSKTADIQQTLAYGAHGPRELVALIRHGAGD